MEVTLQINADLQTVEFDCNKLGLKLSSKENNGLSFVDGKLVATKAQDGSTGTGGIMNTPGNGLGPISSLPTDTIGVVGFNSSVSRHKKYDGNNSFIIENDGPVMTKNNGDQMVANGSIAAYMISYASGG